MPIRKATVLIAAALAAMAAFAGCGRREDEPAAQVDELFSPWGGDGTPGAAVLVAKDGRVLLERCYGLRDLESGAAIDPDTAFLLGSVSKQFTAMAVMMLAERGELSYDDPVSAYLPGFRNAVGGVTIRQLLNHTGGLPEFDALFLAKGLIDDDWPRSIRSAPSAFEPTIDDVLGLLSGVETTRFQPGAEWEYSNSGYVVLAGVVEAVSGFPLPEFLDERVFGPLGMTRSFMSSGVRPDREGVASSYAKRGGAYREIDYAPQSAIYGSNNVYSTIRDLYAWDQALYAESLVSRRSLDEAFSKGRTSDGCEVDYGFGWRIDARSGYRELSHGGRWLGFRSGILRIPERSFTVVILSNTADSRMADWMDRLVELYLGADR